MLRMTFQSKQGGAHPVECTHYHERRPWFKTLGRFRSSAAGMQVFLLFFSALCPSDNPGGSKEKKSKELIFHSLFQWLHWQIILFSEQFFISKQIDKVMFCNLKVGKETVFPCMPSYIFFFFF